MNQQIGNPVASKSFWQRLLAAMSRRLMGTITGVNVKKPLVALTFDDGPDPVFTPKLLDVLKARGAQATFFVVGSAAQQYPELLKRIAGEGHAVGNHSWDHQSFVSLSIAGCLQQLKACRKAIKPFDSGLFRPPFGHLNFRTRLAPWLLGYQVVTWDTTGVDWSGESASDIRDNLKKQWRDGAIVLLHDSLFLSDNKVLKDRSAMIEAVTQLLDSHTDTNFVTVPELLKSGSAIKRNWTMYPEPVLDSAGDAA